MINQANSPNPLLKKGGEGGFLVRLEAVMKNYFAGTLGT
jgi:hypothetical protein